MSWQRTQVQKVDWKGYKAAAREKKRIQRFVDGLDSSSEDECRHATAIADRIVKNRTWGRKEAPSRFKPCNATKLQRKQKLKARTGKGHERAGVSTSVASAPCPPTTRRGLAESTIDNSSDEDAVPSIVMHSDSEAEPSPQRRPPHGKEPRDPGDNIYVAFAENFRDTFISSDEDGPANVSIEEEPYGYLADPLNAKEDLLPLGDNELPCEMVDGQPRYTSPHIQSMLLDILAVKFANVKAQTLCSHATAEKFFNLIIETLPLLRVIDGSISYKTVQRRVAENVPPMSLTHKFQDQDTGDTVSHSGSEFPTKLYGNPLRFRLLSTWTRMSVKDACKSLQEWHPNEDCYNSWNDHTKEPQQLDLSWDGVALDKKNTSVLEVLSVKSPTCRRVIPVGIYIGDNACKDDEQVLQPLIDEWQSLNIRGRHFLMDSKARLSLLKMVAITGYHSCQYCLAPGVSNKGSGHGRERGGHVIWPSKTMGYKKRTHQDYVSDGKEAERTGKTVRGTNGVSRIVELFDDIMTGVPIDTFHCVYLGVAKRIWKETFGVRPNNTMPKELETVKSEFDNVYRTVEVPSEIERRPRAVDPASYKCSEWQSLTLYGFPLLVNILSRHGMRKEASVILQFSFLLRALLMNNPSYNHLKQFVDISALNAKFYKSYEKAFGQASCVPSLHLFYHLVEQRETIPASVTSTEPFESYYNVLRSTYAVGTTSIGKQQITNTMLFYKAKARHHCSTSYQFRPKGKDVHNDSLCWTTDGRFLKIVSTNRGGATFTCHELETSRYTTDVVRKLVFSPMGVTKLKQVKEEVVTLSREEIAAKVVLVGDVLVAVPTDAM